MFQAIIWQAFRFADRFPAEDGIEHPVGDLVATAEIGQVDVRGRVLDRRGWIEAKRCQKLVTARRSRETACKIFNGRSHAVIGGRQWGGAPQEHCDFGDDFPNFQGPDVGKSFVRIRSQVFRSDLRLGPKDGIQGAPGNV